MKKRPRNRLLDGWKRAQKMGITPGQFLILADMVENLDETPAPSIRQRAKRLNMSHCAVQAAQFVLADRKLVCLTTTAQSVYHPTLKRSYPVIVATPLKSAIQLFYRCRFRIAKSAPNPTTSSTTAPSAKLWFAPTTPS